MPTQPLALLRWQFDLTWSLFEYHLERLEQDDLLWEPAAPCWTLHRGADGSWRPDWEDVEPDPVPVPTIAWLSWHMGWWWTVTMAHLERQPSPERESIIWPGDVEEVKQWLRALSTRWSAILDDMPDVELESVATFPWHGDPEMTVAHTLAWVNAELMKNVTEIGQLRLIRA